MDHANAVLVAIGVLSVTAALLLSLLLPAHRKPVFAAMILPIITFIPALTSWESSRRVVEAFRQMALAGTGGIAPIAASLRETTELALFGHRVAIGALLLVSVLTIVPLMRPSPNGLPPRNALFRRIVLIGATLVLLVSAFAVTELSL